MARKLHAFLGAAALLLTSCGGGGGGGGGPPAPANTAPAITSGGTATVPENTTGTVYQAAATDAQGSPVTFSLAGTDAARFAITPAGAISFVAPPDFEAPADSGANNVYDLLLTASDGSLTSQIALTITVTNLPEALTVRRIGSGYDEPRQIVGIPGSNSLFVVERRGNIFLLDPAVGGPGNLFMTVNNIGTFDTIAGGYGVLSMVPAQDYATSGIFYVSVTDPSGTIEIRRYTRATATTGNVASEDVIMRIPTTVRTGTAIAAWLIFGADSRLYILTGEGGNRLAVQNTADLRGKVLRIDLSQDSFPADSARDYGLLSDNPSFNGTFNEVYAYGLYNPIGASFTGASHPADMLFADNPLGDEGEINLLRPQDKGANYGFPAPQTPPAPGVTPPVIRAGINTSATGGYIYRGSFVPLRGTYLFGRGRFGIYGVPASQIAQGSTIQFGTEHAELNPPGVADPFIVSFAEDSQGELYYLIRPGVTGDVYKIEVR